MYLFFFCHVGVQGSGTCLSEGGSWPAAGPNGAKGSEISNFGHVASSHRRRIFFPAANRANAHPSSTLKSQNLTSLCVTVRVLISSTSARASGSDIAFDAFVFSSTVLASLFSFGHALHCICIAHMCAAGFGAHRLFPWSNYGPSMRERGPLPTTWQRRPRGQCNALPCASKIRSRPHPVTQ